MKKRIIALLIASVMLISLTSCGESKKSETDAETATTSVSNEKSDETEVTKQETESETVFGDFTATDIDGNEVTSEIFKGKKVTMVNIWATFCSPCIKEMPDLEKLSKAYADKDFQIVGIACDVENDNLLNTAKDIIEQTGVSYLNILPSMSLNEAKLYNVLSVPETIFIDENGNQIGESYVGSRSYESWSEIVDSILAQVN